MADHLKLSHNQFTIQMTSHSHREAAFGRQVIQISWAS